MNKDVCSNFLYLTTNLKYDSSNKNYQIINGDHLKKHCDNENCGSDLEKISAGCLYFFNEFFGSSSVFESVAKNNINIVDYIIIWLSYMLNLKENDYNNSLNHFYTTYINNEKYKNPIDGVEAYSNYKNIIEKKHDLTKMNIKDISKFYDSFILLCEMYTAFNDDNKNCTNCSEKANKFVEKYKELNSNNNKGSSYDKILSTLSTDYDNLKNKCSNIASFPKINTSTNTEKGPEKASVQNSAQTSEVTSLSSSIGNKLIPVLSIFGAIAFFLGIGYKYSLFKSRKRSRKQHLREKLKNKEENE
ncbi:BIR protein [Plasmodium berghei]|uniref:BIR protein n=2 Tax=Plasmodium berghei TaxID=5821 RepID=A0A1D3JNT6_PLABE|nr:BIR protein [Plasmodium berghei]